MLETALERSATEPLVRHIAACASCAQAFERVRRTRDALNGLPARRAPEALDGLVVAATQAGHRQERVLAHLRTMLREEAPSELEPRIGGGALLASAARQHAPVVLERLIDEDLRDPRKALARRYLDRLDRLGAPGILRSRVAHILVAPPKRVRRGLFAGAAALLVLLAGLWTWHVVERSSSRVRYRLEFVDELSQLDPAAREMLGGLTGGWSEVVGKEHP